MRFLVVTQSREAMPPDMAMPMMQMMQAWVAEHRSTGKMEQVWSFAGMNGGGGIFNVDSHEELDAIMGGFPFGQTSHISIYALADLDVALSDSVERIENMMAMMGDSA
jgi:muconolactone delta-isomerase